MAQTAMPSAPSSFVKVFLFTDLVGSTAIKRSLGDVKGAELVAAHDSIFRSCLLEFGGAEVDNAGDGFLALFDRPSDAVRCALAFQRRLAASEHASDLKVRIGMNMGEAVLVESDGGERKYLGLAVDSAARVMSLADGGQILLTRSSFDSARAQLLEAPDGSPLTWLAHGAYLCKGIDDPVEVCEVGIKGFSVLAPPKDSEKARRNVALDEESTLGWRPAPGQEVPHRKNWLLESKLGDGGFGEVWLAAQKHTRVRRVFKFCFQTDRLRGLKREVALFRILKEALGDRNDIAQILDWQFEEPPFFLEAEYTEGGSLLDWVDDQGGPANVPLDTRIQIVIQTAEALAAAHSVGVLHKDIKPGNILISKGTGGVPQVRLTDFGIGLVTDPALLKGQGTMEGGLPSMAVSGKESSGSGTQMYMAPELFEGKRPTTLCDIYALGVMLYQLASGDLRHALAMGWERKIGDELLREDIAACIEGDPERRLQSAKELADLLRNREPRRLRREQDRRRSEEAARALESEARARRTRRAAAVMISFLTLVVVGAIGFGGMQRRQAHQKEILLKAAEQARLEAKLQRDEADAARKTAESARASAELKEEEFRRLLNVEQMNSAVEAWKDREFTRLENLLLAQLPEPGFEDLRGFDWRYLWGEGHRDPLKPLFTVNLPELPGCVRVIFSPDGRTMAAGSMVPSNPDQPGVVKIFDSATGTEIRTLTGHTRGVLTLAYSPDGKTLATGSQDKTVRIWDLTTGETLRVLEGHTGWITGLCFFPDGKRLVTGGGTLTMNRPVEIFLWDVQTGKIAKRFDTGKARGSVMNIIVSPDGGRMITGTQVDHARADAPPGVAVWDTLKGVTTGGYDAKAEGLALAVSPDGLAIAAGGVSKTLKLFGSSGAEPLLLAGHSDWINSLDFSPDGSRLVTGSGNPMSGSDRGEIFYWNPATGRQEFDPRSLDQGVFSLDFSPDGSLLAAGSTRSRLNVWMWAPEDSRRGLPPATPGRMIGLALAPDGRNVALSFRIVGNALGKASVRIWDPESGKYLAELGDIPYYTHACRFSPDGNLLALSGAETNDIEAPGRVILWKWKTSDPPVSILSEKGSILCLAFSEDGQTLVGGGGFDQKIHFWNPSTGAETASLTGHRLSIQAIALSPDGRLLATATDAERINWKLIGRPSVELGELKVWDAGSRKLLYGLDVHQDGIQSITFSPDGKLLATGGRDRTINFWDAATGGKIGGLELRSALWVESLIFTEDGRTLIAAGSRALRSQRGGELAFIDLFSRRIKADFEIPESELKEIIYSPQGDFVAGFLNDGTLRSWAAPDEKEIQEQISAARAQPADQPSE